VRATVVNKEGEEVTSLALLMIQGRDNFPSGITALPIATAVRLSGGEDIVVIGHPRSAGDWTVLKGSIARREGRHVKVDANVDEGSSGGPMLQNGKVVGLVAGTTKYGLAVTASSIREYLDGNRVPLEEEARTAQATSPGSSPTKPEIREMSGGREITGKDGAPMVLISAGEFWMGSPDAEGYKDEHPRHRVYLDAFYIDRFEVTVARYAEFMRSTGRRAADYWNQVKIGKHDRLPVVGVDWQDADTYCQWAGKRLPTEAEWEKAARGTDGLIYPWGNAAPTSALANFDKGITTENVYDQKLAPVESYEAGKSPDGLHHMAGNVWEWVADWYDENYYAKSPERNPKGPSSGQYRVLRGGSWGDLPVYVRSASRLRSTPTDRLVNIGFRCVQDIPK
jgi:formylglycine-generating enzyme required for sulfatase activity